MNKTPIYSLTRSCTACALRARCKGPVPAVGPVDAKVMIVGEAPGRNEDTGGEPWIGDAGKYLDALLYRSGLHRDDVLFTNTVKCRPQNNDTPTRSEAQFCGDRWLKKEVELFRPQIIMTLGKVATEYFLGEGETIEHRHGIPVSLGDRAGQQEVEGGVGGSLLAEGDERVDVPDAARHGPDVSKIRLLPAYHPASGFHNTGNMRFIQEDFRVLGKLVRREEVARPTDDLTPRYYAGVNLPYDKRAVVALDTEVVDGKLWSVQLSTRPGEGVFYTAEDWERTISDEYPPRMRDV